MKKTTRAILTVFILLFFAVPLLAATPDEIPTPGMVTMVDLGSHKCIPCKMMMPILAKLEKAYSGKAAIIFIDVWEDGAQAQKFKVSLIPTQVFFDQDGKEIFRHQGFMSEEKIIAQLSKMGVQAHPK